MIYDMIFLNLSNIWWGHENVMHKGNDLIYAFNKNKTDQLINDITRKNKNS